MSLANMLLSMSVYGLLPILPQWLADAPLHYRTTVIAQSFVAFGLGLFALGCFCSYLVQHYRRNLVCLAAIAATALCSAALYYIDERGVAIGTALFLALRFLHGACFGLAKMVLASTLIIDTCESFQRTEANYSAGWFSRFALSLGPVGALVCATLWQSPGSFLFSTVCAVLSLLLVKFVSFPFRAPEECVRLVSLDRFFLPQGMVLFLNLLVTTTAAGMVFALRPSVDFYALIMCGFLLSLLSRRFVFANADLMSEAVSGLIVLMAALLIMLSPVETAKANLCPVLLGLGIGVIASRFQLFFIKLSRHCQRGTSQSTFFLGWELGLSIGMAMAIVAAPFAVYIALSLTVIALILYVAYVHRWFVAHKNR